MSTEENISKIEVENGISIESVLSQIPNSTMKNFYIKKVNKSIINSHDLTVKLKDDIKDIPALQSEYNTLNFILNQEDEIYRVAHEEISNTPILTILKLVINSILSQSEQPNSDILSQSLEIKKIIFPWVEIENKIRANNPDIHTLYKYIEDEDLKIKTLHELKEFYGKMF